MYLPRLISSFDKQQEENIHRHCWNMRRKIRKLTKFKDDSFEASQDIVPQSCDILQTLVFVYISSRVYRFSQ